MPIVAVTYPAILGAVLAGIRCRGGKQQQEVARLTGIASSGISRIESGYSLTWESLGILCETYGCKISEVTAEADLIKDALTLSGYIVTHSKDYQSTQDIIWIENSTKLISLASTAKEKMFELR